METLIKQISEIETAAVKLMDEASLQKAELDKEAQERIHNYDARQEEAVEQKLSDMKEELHEVMQKELSSLKETTMNTILNLDNNYAENHEILVQQIFHQLIEG